MMPVETVRVSDKAKDQLVKLKRYTGIKNWNVLCRWAVCVSLAEEGDPPAVDTPTYSNVEMTWRTFAGPSGELLWALVEQRCADRGLDLSDESLADQFRLHLHRGIGYLSADRDIRSIDALVSRAMT